MIPVDEIGKPGRVGRTMLRRGIIVGLVGLVCGYFGPLRYSMEQGPLMGLFVTGPAGFVIGAAAGWVFEKARIGGVVRESIFGVLLIGTAWATLALSRPGPQVFGTVREGVIVRCQSPIMRLPTALSMWRATIAADPSVSVRPEWEREVRRVLQDAHGVVIEFVTRRRRNVYRDGTASALRIGPWIVQEEKAEYFADFAGAACSSYPLVRPERLWAGLPGVSASEEIPPPGVAGVLGVEVLESVPTPVLAIRR